MTIQQRPHHSDIMNYWPKRRNDKDFKDFDELAHFSNHEDDIQSL